MIFALRLSLQSGPLLGRPAAFHDSHAFRHVLHRKRNLGSLIWGLALRGRIGGRHSEAVLISILRTVMISLSSSSADNGTHESRGETREDTVKFSFTAFFQLTFGMKREASSTIESALGSTERGKWSERLSLW